MNAFSIIGTDTEVGKTFCTLGLLSLMRRNGVHAGAFKPVETGSAFHGANNPADWELHKRFSSQPRTDVPSYTYYFERPVSPHFAARIADKPINVENIIKSIDVALNAFSTLLIETAGGLMTPLTINYLFLDLVRELGFPVILISRSGVGTLNHTLMTIDILKRHNVPIQCVVFNRVAETLSDVEYDNMKTISRITRVQCFGPIPKFTGLYTIAALEAHFHDYIPIKSILEEDQ